MISDVLRIDAQDLAGLVPDCYAEFWPLVADGLGFFLHNLSPPRLAEILQAQADLPAHAGLAHRLVRFLHTSPALHKLGQVLARNRHLDSELRQHLQQLESLEPRLPSETLQPILERELAGAGEKYRIRVSEPHLAEGSVAVVVPLTWSDPADGAGAPSRRGVAKILKPGIVERLEEDLDILGRLAGHLEERSAALDLPPLAFRETFAEVSELLIHEVSLPLEQARLRQAASQFAGSDDVRIPQLLPFCTDALTAMERLDGCKVTDPSALSAWQRPAFFRSMVGALVSRVLFSLDDSVLFHGDPHAGNLLVTSDQRLGILDWSLAGQLTREDRVRLSQVVLGAWAMDASKVTGAAAGLASPGADDSLIHRHVDAALADLRWHRLPGPKWVIALFDALTCAGIRFPPRWLLFRKAILMLQGVLTDVYPHCSLETMLLAEGLAQLAWEWPLRWCRPLADRGYQTYLSSADLMHVALQAPAAVLQLCWGVDPSCGWGTASGWRAARRQPAGQT